MNTVEIITCNFSQKSNFLKNTNKYEFKYKRIKLFLQHSGQKDLYEAL